MRQVAGGGDACPQHVLAMQVAETQAIVMQATVMQMVFIGALKHLKLSKSALCAARYVCGGATRQHQSALCAYHLLMYALPRATREAVVTLVVTKAFSFQCGHIPIYSYSVFPAHPPREPPALVHGTRDLCVHGSKLSRAFQNLPNRASYRGSNRGLRIHSGCPADVLPRPRDADIPPRPRDQIRHRWTTSALHFSSPPTARVRVSLLPACRS